MPQPYENLGVVVIGRNEVNALPASLEAVRETTQHVVYVDSASVDGSPELAAALGVEVLRLTPPLSAARARNAGFHHLLRTAPHLELVQFVDGDCVLAPGWIEVAREVLLGSPNLALVGGRLRERSAGRTLLGSLLDVEWDREPGLDAECVGTVMARAEAMQDVGCFRADLIAGEEPELCLRLRRQGWAVLRISETMGVHTAPPLGLRDWWRRCARAGYAYSEGARLHGRSPGRPWVREARRIWAWGLLPLTAAAFAPASLGLSLTLLLAYPIAIARASAAASRRGRTRRDALTYGVACVLGHTPELHGALCHWRDQRAGRSAELIEYRRTAPNGRSPA